MTAISPAHSVAQTIGEDVAVFVGPAVLVSSRSHSGEFHTVLGGACSCIGFSHRGICRHLAIAAEAQELDRQSAEPITDLVWMGSDHGYCPRSEVR